MSNDWVKLYRKLLGSAAFDDPLTLKVWIALLLGANWEERQLINGDKLGPGELIIGQEKFATDLGTTRKKFRTCLLRLEKCGNVASKRASSGTHISICNWETYQARQDDEGPDKGPAKGQRRARGGPTKGQRRATEEEGKKERSKEGEEEGASPSAVSLTDSFVFDRWWALWPRTRQVGQQKAREEYKEAVARVCASGERTVAEAEAYLTDRLQQFAGSPKCQGQFCPNPSTWLAEGRYDDAAEAWREGGPQEEATVKCYEPEVGPSPAECMADLKESLGGKSLKESLAEAMKGKEPTDD